MTNYESSLLDYLTIKKNMILVLYSCVITVWNGYLQIDIFLKKWLFKLFLHTSSSSYNCSHLLILLWRNVKKNWPPKNNNNIYEISLLSTTTITALKNPQHIASKMQSLVWKQTKNCFLEIDPPWCPLYMTQKECKKFTRYNLNCSKY